MTIFKICEHGKVTIRGGKPTNDCENCNNHNPNQAFFVPNMTPFFNHGLGCVTNGTRDAEQKAKRMGLVPIGDAKPEQVFRKEKKDTLTPILKDGLRKIHNLGEI